MFAQLFVNFENFVDKENNALPYVDVYFKFILGYSQYEKTFRV